MNNPLGVSPSKGNQGTTRGKEQNRLTSLVIEPTSRPAVTPDLPTELRGRTEKVGDNLGGESRRRERVHMNVLPRSTMNTNGETEKFMGFPWCKNL